MIGAFKEWPQVRCKALYSAESYPERTGVLVQRYGRWQNAQAGEKRVGIIRPVTPSQGVGKGFVDPCFQEIIQQIVFSISDGSSKPLSPFTRCSKMRALPPDLA